MPVVGSADGSSLGTGAVVTVDINDQSIIKFALILDLLDDTANLMVSVGRVGCEHFCLAGKELLLVRRKFIPVFQDIVWPRRELRVRRNHSQPFLVGEDLFAVDPTQKFTIEARETGFRLAPPTRTPSIPGCAISERTLSGFTLPP